MSLNKPVREFSRAELRQHSDLLWVAIDLANAADRVAFGDMCHFTYAKQWEAEWAKRKS